MKYSKGLSQGELNFVYDEGVQVSKISKHLVTHQYSILEYFSNLAFPSFFFSFFQVTDQNVLDQSDSRILHSTNLQLVGMSALAGRNT